MTTCNLEKLFKPQCIAVMGASEKPSSVGGTVVRNLIEARFKGPIYPVHPTHRQVYGLSAYHDISSVPESADLAIVCTPAATVPEIVRQCGESGVGGLVILSAGFREVGPLGMALEDEIQAVRQTFPHLRIMGPNCLGFLAPRWHLNASFARGTMPQQGRIAFISQSGALCTSLLDWAIREEVGFSYFVSIGNALDVNPAHLIDYFAEDPETDAIVLYLESLQSARHFMSAARAFTRSKPIVAYKAGRFTESAAAAATHTGALAGVDEVYEAALARAGIVRVDNMEEIFDCAELLARHPTAVGPRLAIVTNAGGPGVMAMDALIARQGVPAILSEATLQSLNDCLPAYWSHHNPVDILGDAPPERFAQALQIVLADAGADAALVMLTPQAMTDPTAAAQQVIKIARDSSKPVITAWMGGNQVAEGVALLNHARLATYATPEQAVRAFMRLVSYGRRRELLYETPSECPAAITLPRDRQQSARAAVLAEKTTVISEGASKALLAAYGISATMPQPAASAAEAVQLARQLGYPVVLKVLSPDITHKTDVGGVELNLASDTQVSDAYEHMVVRVQAAQPSARLAGVTVQPMVAAPRGCELILGARRDPVFGSVLMVGAGGIYAEILRDRALELPPLNERLALHLLQSLRVWPLLTGARGRPPLNVDRLLETLIRFSYLVSECPEIGEIDVNPLVVTPESVIALDARLVVHPQTADAPHMPYAHLAIRPYPDEYRRTMAMRDGQSVLLRPIRPEDEPMWHELNAACSPESIHARFHGMIQGGVHQLAARFCFIDYDREMAIVAEIEGEGRRRLVGVARLAADADHREAEFTILVIDAWQGRGLGSMLTDYCLEICRPWGIAGVWAVTTVDNDRMLRIFRRRGFTQNIRNQEEVRLHKSLEAAS